MKKLIALLLVLSSIFALVACANTNKPSETKDTTPAGTTDSAFAAELQKILDNATEDSLKRVLDAGVLTCGCEGNWIPYLYYEEGNPDHLTGFHAEVARAIAAKLGIEVKFDVASQFDGILAGLQSKRYDCISEGLKNSTVSAFEGLGTSVLYTQDQPVIIVSSSNTDIVNIASMNGKKAGNSTTSSYGKIAFNAGCECNPDLDFAMAIQGIINGTIDLTVNSMVVYNTYLETYPEAADKLKIAFAYEPENLEDLQGGITVRTEDASLTAAINLALTELLEDGTIIQLSNKYFGEEFTNSAALYQPYLNK